MRSQADSQPPTASQVVRTALQVRRPPVNWQWPQLASKSSSERPGSLGSKFLILARKATKLSDGFPALKSGDSSMALRRWIASLILENLSVNSPVKEVSLFEFWGGKFSFVLFKEESRV